MHQKINFLVNRSVADKIIHQVRNLPCIIQVDISLNSISYNTHNYHMITHSSGQWYNVNKFEDRAHFLFYKLVQHKSLWCKLQFIYFFLSFQIMLYSKAQYSQSENVHYLQISFKATITKFKMVYSLNVFNKAI